MRFTSILLGLALVLAAAVAVGSLSVGQGDGAPAEAAVSAPPSGEIAVAGGAGLPDLVVTMFEYDFVGIACAPTYGITMHFANNGDAAAGPFVIDLNGSQATISGLGAGAADEYFFLGSPGWLTGTVDFNNDVPESDEGNNTLSWPGFPTHTPVATCTPEGTNTPTATPTSAVDYDGDGIDNVLDNCPLNFNPGQENNDRNFIPASAPLTVNDSSLANSDTAGDVCDPDDDNDGVTDVDEASGAACDGGVTDAFMRDTDGDGRRDGAECALGTDPTDPASRPSQAQCAAAAGSAVGADADYDRLSDAIEYCGYGTTKVRMDSDDDFTHEGCEAVSLNGDMAVNSLDQLQLAFGIIGDLSGPANQNADLNKDGAVNSADQLLMATIMMPMAQCPAGAADLTILTMNIELETGSGCYTSTTLGLRVVVQNRGTLAAGPFKLWVNNAEQLLPGLAAGATTSAWFPGYANPQMEWAIVDYPPFHVSEIEEGNNGRQAFAPIPTLPPACTTTATVTPSPTVTPTATGTPPANYTFMNTGGASNFLDIEVPFSFAPIPPITLFTNAPGCDDPTINTERRSLSTWFYIEIAWPTACVDPGEGVTISFTPPASAPPMGTFMLVP